MFVGEEEGEGERGVWNGFLFCEMAMGICFGVYFSPVVHVRESCSSWHETAGIGLVVCSGMVGCLGLVLLVSVLLGPTRWFSLLTGLWSRFLVVILLTALVAGLLLILEMLRTWLLRLVITLVCGRMAVWSLPLLLVCRLLVLVFIFLLLSWLCRALFGGAEEYGDARLDWCMGLHVGPWLNSKTVQRAELGCTIMGLHLSVVRSSCWTTVAFPRPCSW